MVVSDSSMAGSVLKRLAEEKGLTGKKLAKAIGVAPETVSRHMNNRTHMSKVDAAKYAEVLGVTANLFIADEQRIQIKGSLDNTHAVSLYNSLNSRVIVGNCYLPEHLIAFQYPPELESWMRGRILFINGKHVEDGKVSDKIQRNLSICKIKDEDVIRLCIPYPVANFGGETYDPNFRQKWHLLNPYISQANAVEQLAPVALDWGTHVIIAIQNPSDLYMTIQKT